MPVAANPHAGPAASITAPASGAPIASPTVSAELCRPIASPRTSAGTILLMASAVAASVGAHSAPAGTSARPSHRQSPPASPTGIVNTASSTIRVIGESARGDAPYQKPPAIE
jgi:hypothetical protein